MAPTISFWRSWGRLALGIVTCAVLAACASSNLREATSETLSEAETGRAASESAPAARAAPGSIEAALAERQRTTDPRNSLIKDWKNQALQPARTRSAQSIMLDRGDARKAVADGALLQIPAFRPSALEDGWMAVHMVDGGQAEVMLLEFKCSAAMVDVGIQNSVEKKRKWKAYLNWFFDEHRRDLNRTLNLVILSHGHNDHAVGIPLLLGDDKMKSGVDKFMPVKVLNFVDSGYDTGYRFKADEQESLRKAVQKDGGSIESVRAVDALDWGITSTTIDPIPACGDDDADPEFRVLWGAWDEFNGAPDEPNSHSAVTRLDFGEASFLFMGDLQTEPGGNGGLDIVFSDHAEGLAVFDVDVLKVGHHGASNGTSEQLVANTSPCLAMIGSGDVTGRAPGSAWDYGHPNRIALALLQDEVDNDDQKRVRVSGTRSPTIIPAFDAEETPPVPTEIYQAIFGTAWDGHFVVYANKDGRLEVESEKGVERLPVECAQD